MAVENGSNGMDHKAHARTYSGFISLLKWGTIVSLLVTAGVVAILVK